MSPFKDKLKDAEMDPNKIDPLLEIQKLNKEKEVFKNVVFNKFQFDANLYENKPLFDKLDDSKSSSKKSSNSDVDENEDKIFQFKSPKAKISNKSNEITKKEIFLNRLQYETKEELQNIEQEQILKEKILKRNSTLKDAKDFEAFKNNLMPFKKSSTKKDKKLDSDESSNKSESENESVEDVRKIYKDQLNYNNKSDDEDEIEYKPDNKDLIRDEVKENTSLLLKRDENKTTSLLQKNIHNTNILKEEDRNIKKDFLFKSNPSVSVNKKQSSKVHNQVLRLNLDQDVERDKHIKPDKKLSFRLNRVPSKDLIGKIYDSDDDSEK